MLENGGGLRLWVWETPPPTHTTEPHWFSQGEVPGSRGLLLAGILLGEFLFLLPMPQPTNSLGGVAEATLGVQGLPQPWAARG